MVDKKSDPEKIGFNKLLKAVKNCEKEVCEAVLEEYNKL